MATLRVFVWSQLLSRTVAVSRISGSAIPSSRIAFQHRNFSRSRSLWQDANGSAAGGAEIAEDPTGFRSRSIAMFKVPKRNSRSEIEELLRNQGCGIKRMQLMVDRFSFQNNTLCFVELENEEQAAKAVENLNKSDPLREGFTVRRMNDKFEWVSDLHGPRPHLGPRYFLDDGKSAHKWVAPLIERRRLILRVIPPGWASPKSGVGLQIKEVQKVIDTHFGKYGLEAIGSISPFYGGFTRDPRMVCFLDFATKEGADRAIAEVHDTDIEGRKTWLQVSEITPWRAHQLGKVDKAVLAELQEKGIAPAEVYEDKTGKKMD